MIDIADASLLWAAATRLYVPPKSVENLAFAALLLLAAALLIFLPRGPR